MNSVRALVIDATDPPLGGTERVLATLAPDAVLRGLGLVALAHPRARLSAEVTDPQAGEALRREAARLGAQLGIIESNGLVGAHRHSLRVRPSALAEAAWRERVGPAAHALTIAGAIECPRVLAAPPSASVEALVRAARPTARGWVALWGGAAGELVDRDTTIGALVALARPRLLLVLPAGHALVRRARTSLGTWLRRAQSACASCGLCAPACPESIPAPDLLRALVAGGPVRSGGGARTNRLVAASACTACGACDLGLPSVHLACALDVRPRRAAAQLGRTRVRARDEAHGGASRSKPRARSPRPCALRTRAPARDQPLVEAADGSSWVRSTSSASAQSRARGRAPRPRA